MQRNKLMLAAMASAVMPAIAVAGVREGAPSVPADSEHGIDRAVVQDAAGRLYDVFVSNTVDGRNRLTGRVRAARTLRGAREAGGLGFSLDRMIAFDPGEGKGSVTGGTAVLVTEHHEGQPRELDLLTLDDCSAVGTAIGAIHRLNPTFLKESGYPVFSTGQIRTQLTAWIKRLRTAGHVPAEITTSWANILETEGLWSFTTCPVHGGFTGGDILFSGSTITAIGNWQAMQVNDPAKDLAWIFAKLDENHRNALLASYGRMMGSRLDDLIMLRANLWLQMEEVGDFIQALNRADNNRIIEFKAQVERLAHQLGEVMRRTRPAGGTNAAAASGASAAGTSATGSGSASKPSSANDADETGDSAAASAHNPSTITVSTLLDERERWRNNPASTGSTAVSGNGTDHTDRTGSSEIKAASEVRIGDTADRPVSATQAATVAIAQAGTTGHATFGGDADDSTPDGMTTVDAPTIAIPLLEREERALRDARAGLEGFDAEGRPLDEYNPLDTSATGNVIKEQHAAENASPDEPDDTTGDTHEAAQAQA